MRKAALLVLILVYYAGLRAQQVTGLVQEQGKPLPGASIALKNDKDSSVVKLSISNSSGEYGFSPVAPGKYFITVSHIGFTPQSSASFQTLTGETNHIAAITLPRAAHQLHQTVVTGHKPLVEARTDRVVLNVEGNINEVGSDALELLRKSPGVTVDKDNNLSLNGKSSVQVYVDGRPTYLSSGNLADYLRTLSSSSIESIEIISNPSAKYDAAGNAGIINIRLKKNRAYGTNMSVTAGYNIGTYSKYNGAFSFNHRDRNINIFGDYSYNHN